MQDTVLVGSFLQWNASSFWEIYEKYVDDIYRFVYRKTWDTQTAEDLTSDIWIKIFKNIAKYSEQSWATFRSWIYTIAQNTVIDYYRTHKQNTDIDESLIPAIDNDFAQMVDNSQTLKDVTSYLQTLSPREQEIVFLRVWDDLSYKEISKILWISIDNCKQIYSRSLKKIQANVALVFLIFLLIL